MLEEGKTEVSLREFIIANYSLVAVLGVFGALTALFTRLEGGEYLAFMSFVGFVLVDWELIGITFLAHSKVSHKLYVFQIVLFNLFLGLTMYLVVFYAYALVMFLPVVLLFLYGGAVLKTLSKLKGLSRVILLVILSFVGGALLGLLTQYLLA